jgi:hypothetical protein
MSRWLQTGESRTACRTNKFSEGNPKKNLLPSSIDFSCFPNSSFLIPSARVHTELENPELVASPNCEIIRASRVGFLAIVGSFGWNFMRWAAVGGTEPVNAVPSA